MAWVQQGHHRKTLDISGLDVLDSMRNLRAPLMPKQTSLVGSGVLLVSLASTMPGTARNSFLVFRYQGLAEHACCFHELFLDDVPLAQTLERFLSAFCCLRYRQQISGQADIQPLHKGCRSIRLAELT